MFVKTLSIAALGGAIILSAASTADAGGWWRRSRCYTAPTAVYPAHAPTADVTTGQVPEVRRSYSYEPSVDTRSYSAPHVSSALLPKSDSRKQNGMP